MTLPNGNGELHLPGAIPWIVIGPSESFLLILLLNHVQKVHIFWSFNMNNTKNEELY